MLSDAIKTSHASKKEIIFKMASSVLIVRDLDTDNELSVCSLTEDLFTTVFPCFLCAIGFSCEEKERHCFDKR